MQLRKPGAFILAAALSFTLPAASALSQTTDSGTKRDMKSAGHETKDAVKDTGHGIEKGTKKVFHKTKRATKKVGRKIEGKKTTTTASTSSK